MWRPFIKGFKRIAATRGIRQKPEWDSLASRYEGSYKARSELNDRYDECAQQIEVGKSKVDSDKSALQLAYLKGESADQINSEEMPVFKADTDAEIALLKKEEGILREETRSFDNHDLPTR
jgi:hypothetical protein